MPVKTTLPEGGLDRLVGHVDDLVQGQAPELHVHVDEPHHLAEGATPQVAEWFGEAPANQKSCARDRGQGPLRHLPRGRRGVLRRRSRYWTTPTQGLRRRPRRRSARTTPSGSRPGRRSRARSADRSGDSARAEARRAARLAGLLWRRRAAARAAAGGAARLAGDRLPRLARRPVRRGVLARSTRSRGQIVHELRARQLPDARRGAPSTARSCCGRWRSPRAVTVTDIAARVPDRVLHGQGRVAARARRCSSSRC